MRLIQKYFPNLSEIQFKQFEALQGLYGDWNSQINVISRKDIESLYLRHVLHSLSIAKLIQFKAGAKILDIGTGGGFPGIPLAILFPEVTHPGRNNLLRSNYRLYLYPCSSLHSYSDSVRFFQSLPVAEWVAIVRG